MMEITEMKLAIEHFVTRSEVRITVITLIRFKLLVATEQRWTDRLQFTPEAVRMVNQST